MLGVDPGPVESAIAQVSYRNGEWDITTARYKNELLLDVLRKLGHMPMAIEVMQCMGMAVGQSVFVTAEWIGRFTYVHGGQQFRVRRSEVKSHICGTQKAKDTNIRRALIDKFGDPGTVKNPGKLHGVSKDGWSAIAIALTALKA